MVFALHARWSVDGLDSAGLALALGTLATQQGWPLPPGIGFTGAWDNRGRLAPVSGIPAKLGAAREAGIFTLFACASPEEGSPQLAGEGVDLVLLPKGSNLAEVVRLVKSVCRSRGLMKDRWVNQPINLTRYLVEPYDGTALPGKMGPPELWLGNEGYKEIRSALDWDRPVQILGIPKSGKTLMVAKALLDEDFAGKLASSRKKNNERVVLLLLDLADVHGPQELDRVLMRAFRAKKVIEEFDITADTSGKKTDSHDEGRERLLDGFNEWLRKRWLLLVVDNAQAVLQWRTGIQDLKELLGEWSVRKRATCILITRDIKVNPVRIGYSGARHTLQRKARSRRVDVGNTYPAKSQLEGAVRDGSHN